MVDIGLRYGFISGFVSTFLLTLIYVFNKEWFVFNTRWISWVVIVITMVMAALRARTFLRAHQETMDFMTAFRTAFVTFMVGNLVSVVFVFVMFRFYDSGLNEIIRNYDINYVEAQKSTLTTTEFEQKMDAIKTMNYAPQFWDIFVFYGMTAIMGAFVSALVSLGSKNDA